MEGKQNQIEFKMRYQTAWLEDPKTKEKGLTQVL
jgi:hypothetical protein